MEKIIIVPKEAKLERDTEYFIKMDPYVVIKYCDQVRKTKPHTRGGKNPKWHEVSFKILKLYKFSLYSLTILAKMTF